MDIKEIFMALLVAMSIPSGITGFCFWMLQRNILKREEKEKEESLKRQKIQDEKEKNREKLELQIIQGISASIALGEATAKAVQRIPDAKCNGDMHAALEYAIQIKNKHKDFVNEQFVKNIV